MPQQNDIDGLRASAAKLGAAISDCAGLTHEQQAGLALLLKALDFALARLPAAPADPFAAATRACFVPTESRYVH
jgi:hypothetical protein